MRAELRIILEERLLLLYYGHYRILVIRQDNRRDAYSSYFTDSSSPGVYKVQVRIQNSTGTYDGSLNKRVGIDWLELIAYDVFEDEE